MLVYKRKTAQGALYLLRTCFGSTNEMHVVLSTAPSTTMHHDAPILAYIRFHEAYIHHAVASHEQDGKHTCEMRTVARVTKCHLVFAEQRSSHVLLFARTYAAITAAPPSIIPPTQAFAGTEDLVSLPGSPDEANPTTWVQVAGDPVSFDATTGARISSPLGSAAVFALTEGSYFCMLVESDGEAALFDAPEGEQNKVVAVFKKLIDVYTTCVHVCTSLSARLNKTTEKNTSASLVCTIAAAGLRYQNNETNRRVVAHSSGRG